MRKKFNCGHRGLGKWCHRCEQSMWLRVAAENAEKRDEGHAKVLGLRREADRLAVVPQTLRERGLERRAVGVSP